MQADVLQSETLQATIGSIARAQRADGCIPWWEGGPADPWNHVEAAMALDAGGLHEHAERAYRWLAGNQRGDGAWHARYDGESVTDAILDANFTAYSATGVWHHWLTVGDGAFLEDMWAVVDAAIEFTLALQLPGGAVSWARDASYRAWPRALLTSSSCIHLSLRCAIEIAETLGEERPDWELSLEILDSAIASGGPEFLDKDRFAMDWYYPVLCGALSDEAGRARLRRRWGEFVVEGLGSRCVSDRSWVTAAETCELVIALASIGMRDEGARLWAWAQHLRVEDGSYWTGATFPDGVVWPRERTTWSAGAVVLAAHALWDEGPTAALFRPRARASGAPAGSTLARSR